MEMPHRETVAEEFLFRRSCSRSVTFLSRETAFHRSGPETLWLFDDGLAEVSVLGYRSSDRTWRKLVEVVRVAATLENLESGVGSEACSVSRTMGLTPLPW